MQSIATPLPQRPEPPAELPKDARALWISIVADYEPRHFRGANLVLLENLCRAHSLVRQCDRLIKRRGLLIGGKKNPAVEMRATGWAEMRACATKLRLSISALQRADSAKVRPDERQSLRKPWERA